MAKKVRKPRAASPRTYAQMPAAPAPAAPPSGSTTVEKAAAPVKAANGVQPVASVRTVDLAQEYASVGGDLRRLLLTAAIMFAVLIAVNLVINFVR